MRRYFWVPVGPEDELGVFATGMPGEEPALGFTLNGRATTSG